MEIFLKMFGITNKFSHYFQYCIRYLLHMSSTNNALTSQAVRFQNEVFHENIRDVLTTKGSAGDISVKGKT